jgi:RNA polymerase sigma-70 factor (ECF subfamily)
MVGSVPTATVTQQRTLDAAMAGDVAAFAQIVRAHHDDMVRVCQVICGDPDLSQDAVQAAWAIAWRRLGSLRDPDRLRPWLISVAANEARQLQRRLRRDHVVAIDVVDVEADGSDPAIRAADADLLAAVRRLPAEDRALLAMRYVAGFDATEIADAVGISASGVRSRLSRLVLRLRTEIGDE